MSLPEARAVRPPVLRLQLADDELIVDSFAGGGGASTGIELALRRSPDIAINHDAEAIAMHAANHPTTRHYCESVWDVDPLTATGGRKVALAWFSPDCKHFSKAKGGKPVDTNVRGLAWIAVKWAEAVRPRVICVENVEEFQSWGPLLDDNRPCPIRKGLIFRQWWAAMEALGYRGELRELRACDYGAPTTRKRLFIVFRCDGEAVAWPAPTHGPGRPDRYGTAADCIDFSDLGSSIFERTRPLAENTLRRIARGLRRYVIESATPFVIPVSHSGDARTYSIDEPMRTITASSRSPYALVSPTLIQTGYGERPGQAPRSLDLHAPLGTVVAGGAKHALVTAFLARHYGGHENDGAPLTQPMHTVTCQDHHALVTAHVSGEHVESVRAFLLKYYGTDGDPQLREPMHTVTTRDRFGLVTVHGLAHVIADIRMRMLTPRELSRAQGFPETYLLDAPHHGVTLSKTAQVRMVGNSVCPPLAAAIVRAQFAQSAAAARGDQIGLAGVA